MSVLEKAFEYMASLLGRKAVWTTAYANNLPDSAFLFIESGQPKDDEGKTVPRSARHFPYKDADGQIDLPHLRNAIARIPQSNAPGLDDTRKAALQARARTLLQQATGTKEGSLDELIREVRDAWFEQHPAPESLGHGAMASTAGYVDEVFPDYVIVEQEGGLLKVPWGRGGDGEITFGEAIPVEEVYVPTKAAVSIYKQADGQLRWVGVVSNHFRDRDNPPEILSGQAHREYTAWATKNQAYPELWLWHQPGSKVGKADFVDFHDGLLMTSGTFTNKDAGEKLVAETEPLTMSHGFLRLKTDPATNITDAYRMFEASIGPEGFEANPFTKFTAQKEATMLSEKQKVFLSKYLGEDAVSKIEGDTEALKSAAIAAGVDWKDVDGADAAAAIIPDTTALPEGMVSPPPTTDNAGLVEQLTAALVDPLVNAISERLQLGNLSTMLSETGAKADQVAALAGRLAQMETALKALAKTDDQKIAEKMTPKAGPALAWLRGSADSTKEATKLTDSPADQALKAASPSALGSFLSKALV